METCDLKIRMPSEIKRWLSHRADHNSRTMNGELLHLIKTAMKAETKGQAVTPNA
jgi:Arc-like DNA binding domain